MEKKDYKAPVKPTPLLSEGVAKEDSDAIRRAEKENKGSLDRQNEQQARPAVSEPSPFATPSSESPLPWVHVPASKMIPFDNNSPLSQEQQIGGNSVPATAGTNPLPNKGAHSNPECYSGLGSTQEPRDGSKVSHNDHGEGATSTKDLAKKKVEGNAEVRRHPTVTSVKKMGITKDASKTLPNSGSESSD